MGRRLQSAHHRTNTRQRRAARRAASGKTVWPADICAAVREKMEAMKDQMVYSDLSARLWDLGCAIANHDTDYFFNRVAWETEYRTLRIGGGVTLWEIDVLWKNYQEMINETSL